MIAEPTVQNCTLISNDKTKFQVLDADSRPQVGQTLPYFDSTLQLIVVPASMSQFNGGQMYLKAYHK